MVTMERGRLVAGLAEAPQERAAALALRAACFRSGACDDDRFDAAAAHVLITERGTSRALATCRVSVLGSMSDVVGCYTGQFYDLSPMTRMSAPMLEVGRFCVAPEGQGNPDVLRLAWGALARIVDRVGAAWLFGCTSFPGLDAAPYRSAFAVLGAGHLGPPDKRPGQKAAQLVALAGDVPQDRLEMRAAQGAIPALLRSYLGLGGWVSDHAVIDPDLETIHVFTALEVAAVPAARAKRLRTIAG